MALVFLNGGSPYTGFQFTTTAELLAQIETTLVAAGWTVEATSSTNRFMKGLSIVGSFPCFIDFVVSGTSPALTLTMRGWLQAAKTNGSPNSVHISTFTDGSVNRMWLTADEEAGDICIFNQNGACSGHHFGFVDRYDKTDANAWMIGRIHSSGYLYAYVARAKFNNTIWKQISTDYTGYTTDPHDPSGGTSPFVLSTFDQLSRFAWPATNPFTNTTNGNVAFRAYDGRKSFDGNCVIDPYLYIEGNGSTTAYGSANWPFPAYPRGLIKYAFCGVASLAAGQFADDAITGNKILSVGGNQWQGMRIL